MGYGACRLLVAFVLCVCLSLMCCFDSAVALFILDLLDFIARGAFAYFGGLMVMIDYLYLRFAVGFRWFALWFSVLVWLGVWCLIGCWVTVVRLFGVVLNCAFVCCVLSCVWIGIR